MQHRPFVEAIANGLEGTLIRNDTKPAWEKQDCVDIFKKFYEEYAEFMEAVFSNNKEAVVREGFDLMNATAMLMTLYGFGDPAWKRGRAV